MSDEDLKSLWEHYTSTIQVFQILGITLVFAGFSWVVAAVFTIAVLNIPSATAVVPALTTLAILTYFTGGHPIKALVKYWNNSVRGFVAEFWVDESDDLQFRILDRTAYKVAVRDSKNYFVALGGWFLWTSSAVGDWDLQRYESNIGLWLGSEGPLYVYLKDHWGSKIKMPLGTALSILKEAQRADWRNSWDIILPDLFRKRQDRFVAVEAIDKAIDMILEGVRFKRSKEGSAVRQYLEEKLKIAGPELVRDRFVQGSDVSSAA